MNSIDRTDLLLEKANSYLYANYGKRDTVLVRGEGARLWDSRGRSYLDFYAGVAVSTLGHGHPVLREAIAKQAAELIHVANYFHTEPNILLAEELCTRTGLARVLFCNSGTEANEALLKLARRTFYDRGEPERFKIVAFEGSFHGRTLGALATTGTAKYREGFGPLLGAIHVPFGDLDAVRAAMSKEVAAILVEPIQGENGVIVPPPEFLPGLRRIADEAGALLLVDEIQTGVGRTGTFLGLESSGIVPDAISLAKGLGGGVPIGAMLCGPHLAHILAPGLHGTTFGGNPLASAAALAVLSVVDQERLVERARELGEYFGARLESLKAKHPRVIAHRGRGLLHALELSPELPAKNVIAELKEAGLLAILAGQNALRFAPPLIVTREILDEGLALIDQTLATLSP
jgi:acetylornithine/N-succinyldiaminopimelate aminotransferase